ARDKDDGRRNEILGAPRLHRRVPARVGRQQTGVGGPPERQPESPGVLVQGTAVCGCSGERIVHRARRGDRRFALRALQIKQRARRRSGLGSLFWNFVAFAPRLRESYRDRLLATLDLLARAPTAQRAALALVHRSLDLFLRPTTVFPLRPFLGHVHAPSAPTRSTVSRIRATDGQHHAVIFFWAQRRGQ